MREPYRWLSYGLPGGRRRCGRRRLFLLDSSRTVDFDAEASKWLLTVAVAHAVTGALTVVVKQIDQRRSERLEAMREYLDAMGGEYQTGYLCVARQQRLDELWLTDQMEAAKEAASVPPSLPELLAEPTKAWRQLEDPARFPRLAALLDDAFRIDRFRAAVLAELLVPAITLTTSATTPAPPVLIQIARPQTVLVALAVAVLPVLAASLTLARRPDAAAELRAVEAA